MRRAAHYGLYLLALLQLLSTGGRAQEEEWAEDEEYGIEEALAPPPIVRAQALEATAVLHLDEQQREAITSLLLDYQTEATTHPPQSEADASTRKRALRAAARRLLTTEQRAELDAWSGAHPLAGTAPPKKRKWFDVLIDDVAAPIIEKRRRKKDAGGGR